MTATPPRRDLGGGTETGGRGRTDVAVVGLGPAGRALAHRLAAQGARVAAYDPAPERPWRATYGGWAAQLPAWLPQTAIGARAPRTVLQADERMPLFDEYVVLDTGGLQRSLDLDGVDVRPLTVTDDELGGLAPVVVDARGARPLGSGPRVDVPAQTAYGLAMDSDRAAPMLLGDDAVLMDWRPFDGARRWGSRSASFCYTVPLPDGRVLVEETVLAATPAVPVAELEDRLRTRLQLMEVQTHDEDEAERVWIPMRAQPARHSLPRFGAAGPQGNPVTGYSVFPALAAADAAARSLLSRGRLPAPPTGVGAIRTTALGAVLGLVGNDTYALFDAFSRLPAHAQRAVMDPATPLHRLLPALAGQWRRMPATGRAALIAATATAPRRMRGTPAPEET